MAPMADLQDGLLDVLLVRKTKLMNLVKLFPKIYSGKHIQSELLEYRQVKSISVESEYQQALTIDGEIKGSVPFAVSVLQEKLVVIA